MRLIFLLLALLSGNLISAQYVYTIKADSVKLTSCDSSELIIENHTQGIKGFLFNKGNGRTEFRKGLVRLSDSAYLVGDDTLQASPPVNADNGLTKSGSVIRLGGALRGDTHISGSGLYHLLLDSSELHIGNNSDSSLAWYTSRRILLQDRTGSTQEEIARYNENLVLKASSVSGRASQLAISADSVRMDFLGNTVGQGGIYFDRNGVFRTNHLPNKSSLLPTDSLDAVDAGGNHYKVGTSALGAAAAGDITQIQYNNGGVFGASPDLTYAGGMLGIGFTSANGALLILADQVNSGHFLQFDSDNGFLVSNGGSDAEMQFIPQINGNFTVSYNGANTLEFNNDGQLIVYASDMYHTSRPILDLQDLWSSGGSYTGLRLNAIQRGSGSGAASLLTDLQLDSVSKFSVSKGGNIVAAGTIQTGNPGSGQGAWDLGQVHSAAITVDPAKYVEVKINGVVYKLVTAN